METKMENQEKTREHLPQLLNEGLSRFDERLEAGEYSPYQARTPGPERPREFKRLRETRGIRYAGCTLDNYQVTCGEQQAVVKTIRDFCENMPARIQDGGGLVLLGPPGTGKDHLLAAAMRSAVIDHGFSVAWADGLRLYQLIKSAISQNKTEAFLASMFKPQILALSDPVPPRDELTAYELCILRDIVEHRYSHGLSTWVTTNVDNKEDAQRLFSGAVLDRLLHGATELFCDWGSFRKPNQGTV